MLLDDTTADVITEMHLIPLDFKVSDKSGIYRDTEDLYEHL
jgi:hypothetical protein